MMIHHAKGASHVAHLLPCPIFTGACSWPILPEGDDGKCDWCREADQRWEDLRGASGRASEREQK